MNEQILIVGAGAIGCALASYLLAKDWAVTVWDTDMAKDRPLSPRRLYHVQASIVDRWPPDTALPDIVIHAYGKQNLSAMPNDTALTYCGAPLALVSRFPKARHVSLSSRSPNGLRAYMELTRDRLVNNAANSLVVYIPEVHGLLWSTHGLVDRAIEDATVFAGKTEVSSIWGAELLPMLESAALDVNRQEKLWIEGVNIVPKQLAEMANLTCIQSDTVHMSAWCDGRAPNSVPVVYSKQTLYDVALFIKDQRNARIRTVQS